MATIIDVRTTEEFTGGHYPGAINIPVEELYRRVDEIKDLPPPFIVYCRSGNRSSIAVTLLRQSGINDVRDGGALKDMLKKRF